MLTCPKLFYLFQYLPMSVKDTNLPVFQRITHLHIFPHSVHISKCGYVEVHISPHLNVEVSRHINKRTFGPPTPNVYQQGTIALFIRGS